MQRVAGLILVGLIGSVSLAVGQDDFSSRIPETPKWAPPESIPITRSEPAASINDLRSSREPGSNQLIPRNQDDHRRVPEATGSNQPVRVTFGGESQFNSSPAPTLDETMNVPAQNPPALDSEPHFQESTVARPLRARNLTPANDAGIPQSVVVPSEPRDESVQLATYLAEDPMTPSSNSVGGLLDRYRLNGTTGPSKGLPLTVEEAMAQTSPDRRKAMIKQYWVTFGKWCRSVDARDVNTKLKSINANTQLDQQVLQGAVALSEADMQAAELDLALAQTELGRFFPMSSNTMFLPSDLPLTDRYETQFEWYASRNRVPPEHRQVDLVLSQLLPIIQNYALATSLNDSSLSAANSNTSQALQALDQLSRSRSGLLNSIVQYNNVIAGYTLDIASWDSPPQKLASMLVLPVDSASQFATTPISSRTAAEMVLPNATPPFQKGFDPGNGRESQTHFAQGTSSLTDRQMIQPEPNRSASTDNSILSNRQGLPRQFNAASQQMSQSPTGNTGLPRSSRIENQNQFGPADRGQPANNQTLTPQTPNNPNPNHQSPNQFPSQSPAANDFGASPQRSTNPTAGNSPNPSPEKQGTNSGGAFDLPPSQSFGPESQSFGSESKSTSNGSSNQFGGGN